MLRPRRIVPENIDQLLGNIMSSLTSVPPEHSRRTLGEIKGLINDHLPHMRRTIDMLAKEVQDLMTQAQKNNSLTAALDQGFRALTLQVATLQQQVNSLQGNGVITDAEKAQLVQTTNDLAASFSTLSKDIPANTEAAPPASTDTSSGNQPAPVDNKPNIGDGNTGTQATTQAGPTEPVGSSGIGTNGQPTVDQPAGDQGAGTTKGDNSEVIPPAGQ